MVTTKLILIQKVAKISLANFMSQRKKLTLKIQVANMAQRYQVIIIILIKLLPCRQVRSDLDTDMFDIYFWSCFQNCSRIVRRSSLYFQLHCFHTSFWSCFLNYFVTNCSRIVQGSSLCFRFRCFHTDFWSFLFLGPCRFCSCLNCFVFCCLNNQNFRSKN